MIRYAVKIKPAGPLAIQPAAGDNSVPRGLHFPGMNAVDNLVQEWLRMASWGALLVMASNLSDAMVQSQRPDAGAGNSRLAFLSERKDEPKPPQMTLPESPQDDKDNRSFDGAWTFTSAGCSYTGSLPARIVGGKILIRGGSGQVDPDGTLHSVGAGNGMTLTAVGQLSGHTGL